MTSINSNFSQFNPKINFNYFKQAVNEFEKVKSYPNDSANFSTKKSTLTKQEAIEQFKKEYKTRPVGDLKTMKEQKAGLDKFVDNDGILKLHSAGVSSKELKELMKGAFPKFMLENTTAMFFPFFINTPLISAKNPLKLIEQMHSFYGEYKEIGEVLCQYKNNKDQAKPDELKNKLYQIFDLDNENKIKFMPVVNMKNSINNYVETYLNS